MKTQPFRAGRMLGLGLFLFALTGLESATFGQDVGFRGPSLTGSGPTTGSPSVTESKPESKLWFHNGKWWGSLWSASALAFHIHRLNAATHAWVDTGVAVEARPDSHCDTLSDGNTLYIASHEFATGGGSPGDPLLVFRYSYLSLGDTYILDPGFPVTIGDSSSETLVIDKDSSGTLWAVWIQGLRVHVAHTLGSDTSWSAPAILPVSTSDVTTDDICSVIHFGNRIGVMWSDQTLSQFFFSTHVDGTADTAWSAVEEPLPGESDDHIHLGADAAGRVYASLKNAANQIKLVVRDGTGWHPFLVSDAADGWTRAIVLLDEQARILHLFATVGPTAAGGSIFEKTSSMDNIAFAAGAGTQVIHDGSGLVINNATSTKQNLDASTGLVVLAANVSTAGNYWHHEVPGISPGNGLVLSVSPGVAGAENVFTATGATPGSVVGFYLGLRLGSSLITRPQCPSGVPIELGPPFQRIGTARANRAGVATFRIVAPITTAGRLFHFQAVEPNSCRASQRVDDEM